MILAGIAPAAAKGRVPFVSVPCNATLLGNVIVSANTTPVVLRLASFCTYDITSQLPPIIGKVTLYGGPSTVIRHSPASIGTFRLLDVASGGLLRVLNVVLRNGDPSGSGGSDGGAIRNAGRLLLNHVTISNNLAGIPLAGNGNGGALANLAGARAVITYTLMTANEAFSTGITAGTGNGGAIYNAGDLTLFGSRLVSNNATSLTALSTTGNGGGINTHGGTSRIIQSTIADNSATNNGGGMLNAGTTQLILSLVLRNRATSGGGVSGAATIRRSIIRGNNPDDCVPTNPLCG